MVSTVFYASQGVFTFSILFHRPFGDGPRNCIGLRLGKLQTKVGLILMLQNHNYHLTENTLDELKMSAKTFLLAAEGGINLRMTPRRA